MADQDITVFTDDDTNEFPSRLPLLPLRDVVVFPTMVTPLLVGRARSVAALEASMDRDKYICVSAQLEADVEDPGVEDVYPVGTVIKILQIIRTPDDTLKILVEGRSRVRIEEFIEGDDFCEVRIAPLVEVHEESTEVEALSRSIKDRFKDYVRLNKRLPDEVLMSVLNMDAIAQMTDSISAYIVGKVPEKQQLLEEVSLLERMRRVNQVLAEELDILELEQRIDSEVQSQVQKNQREFYLNEQLRAIRKELGYGADDDAEVEDYHKRIADCALPDDAR